MALCPPAAGVAACLDLQPPAWAGSCQGSQCPLSAGAGRSQQPRSPSSEPFIAQNFHERKSQAARKRVCICVGEGMPLPRGSPAWGAPASPTPPWGIAVPDDSAGLNGQRGSSHGGSPLTRRLLGTPQQAEGPAHRPLPLPDQVAALSSASNLSGEPRTEVYTGNLGTK